MNLTDPEILELNALCGALVDETITDAQRERLAGLLAGSEAARRFYVRAMGQSASLFQYASEMQIDAADRGTDRAKTLRRVLAWGLPLLAAAAAWVIVFRPAKTEPAPEPLPSLAAGALQPFDYVARLTGSREVEWSPGSGGLLPGSRLRRGQRLELVKGHVEITFDCGAQLVLEGPAALDVNSAWETTLQRGALKASVPPEAIGFRVSNAAVDVVDLGTEFTMAADDRGSAEVLVLKGEVEATPRDTGDQDTILLRQNESRRFDLAGVSDVSDGGEKFAGLTGSMVFDRLAQSTRYAHWSFDEQDGLSVKADVGGAVAGNLDFHLSSSGTAPSADARPEGHRNRALRFDGELYAQGTFPGLSDSSSHTVAFWVRVPVDAQLSDAYTMVAWATTAKKLGARPVHINWNRNPAEGPIGALRTDFGGGCAIGMTSLRDGRWHFVAVFFSPGDDPAAQVQAKQYVDGRLESSTIIPGKTRAPAGAVNPGLTDVVWLGCRLGATGPRQDRFRGEIDELFIADRGLEPFEIVQLMRDNRLPISAVAGSPRAVRAPLAFSPSQVNP
jgi:hypothetical protein